MVMNGWTVGLCHRLVSGWGSELEYTLCVKFVCLYLLMIIQSFPVHIDAPFCNCVIDLHQSPQATTRCGSVAILLTNIHYKIHDRTHYNAWFFQGENPPSCQGTPLCPILCWSEFTIMQAT